MNGHTNKQYCVYLLVALFAVTPELAWAQADVRENPSSIQPQVLPGTTATPEIPTDLFDGTVLQPTAGKAGPRTAVAARFLAAVSAGAYDDAAVYLDSDHLFQEIGSPGRNERGRAAVIKQLQEFRKAAKQSAIVPTRFIETRQVVAVQASVKSVSPGTQWT